MEVTTNNNSSNGKQLQFNATEQQKINNNSKLIKTEPLLIPKRINALKTSTDDCDIIADSAEMNHHHHQRAESPSPSDRLPHKRGILNEISRPNSKPASPSFRRENSMRSLKYGWLVHDLNLGKNGSDSGSQLSKPHSDAASVRSWASVGMGSTDGKKMIVRRVPTSPVELFNIVNPPTPPEEYLYDGDSDDGSDDEDSVYIKPRRQHWSNKLQFVLACIGYSVGLGSVWRFPYLCYKSGGGVFLIPYAIIMIVCGVPMLYMELAVGQFTGRGPIGALGHLCPLLKGTGLGSVVISFLMSTYYSVIIAYGIYYFFTSFKAKQPWEDCLNRWNTELCWMPGKSMANVSNKPLNSQTPAEEFYDKKVLQIGRGIEDFDSPRWELVACLVCAWVLVYFAIWKSIKSSAKVRYFTATLPFVLIIVFMAKSLTLEGANKGLRYFFRPRFELLLDAKVWVNAAAQTFNSMGIAFGSMISFASYSKYNNNILHDTLAVSFVNAITSLLVGIFAFATIGNIATEQNTSIEDVITDGPGLIFVVYPQAMAKMPAAQLWAVLFFFMLLCLALNSQFAIVEVVVTSIQDGFPVWIKKNLMCHEILVLIICGVSLICGLPNVTQGGIYFFQLMDHYAASISIMYLAFFEIVAIAWFYGVWRLSKNIKTMTGRQPSVYFKFCWLVASPLLIFAVWVFCMIDYESPTYNNGAYRYPTWAIVLGWIISALSILCIPICMIYVFLKAPGITFIEKLKSSLKSDLCDKCPKCSEFDCDCVLKEDEIEPMLIMQKPPIIIKDETTLNSIPFLLPINKNLHLNKINRINAQDKLVQNNIQKSEQPTDTNHIEANSNNEGDIINKVEDNKPEEDINSPIEDDISDDSQVVSENLLDEKNNEVETDNSQNEVETDNTKRQSVQYTSHIEVSLTKKLNGNGVKPPTSSESSNDVENENKQ